MLVDEPSPRTDALHALAFLHAQSTMQASFRIASFHDEKKAFKGLLKTCILHDAVALLKKTATEVVKTKVLWVRKGVCISITGR